MITCVCKKQFRNRSAIGAHISRLRRTQPDASHWALRDDHDSSTGLADPPPTGHNAAVPHLVAAAVLHDDEDNEVLIKNINFGIVNDVDGTSFAGGSPMEPQEDEDLTLIQGCVIPNPLETPLPGINNNPNCSLVQGECLTDSRPVLPCDETE